MHPRIGTACSGNGVCGYSDPSGGILLGCTILNVTCSATCACNTGFGGMDCSLNAAALTTRDSIRYPTDAIMITSCQSDFSDLTILNYSILNYSLYCRSAMCQAVVNISSIQDESTGLLESLTSSLSLAFVSSEVVSDNGKASCSTALSKISYLAAKGHLQGSVTTAQIISDLISSFVVPISHASNKSSGGIKANAIASTSFSDYPVATAVSCLDNSIHD